MCGIVGYAGKLNAADIIIEALKNLEYRGYDSAGLSVFVDNNIKTIKSVGCISNLEDKKNKCEDELNSNVGIGHTRWATHGKPTEENAHPHTTDKVSVVHNGIIENYVNLKEFLISKGYLFKTETDSESVALLLDYYYNGNPIETIAKLMRKIEGSYSLGIMFKDKPKEIYALRKECPLIVAVGDNQNFLASDISAVLKYTNKYYVIEHGDIAKITSDKVTIVDTNGNEIKKDIQIANWDITNAEKCGYEHFMIKEINEQPQSILSTVSSRIKNGLPDFTHERITDEFLKQFKKIYIVACGTAMHAGMIGKTLIEKIARIPVEVDIASEFRYRNPILEKDNLVIVISQSGETADTLAALRLAKDAGIATIAIVNVNGSSIARDADKVILTFAGTEISVASTKAYSVQVSIMYLLAIKIAMVSNKLGEDEARHYTQNLMNVPKLMKKVIGLSDCIKDIAISYKDSKNMFFLGRGLDYSMSLEGALKLKEISYIHCESYAAGELKHGTIALITNNMPVVCIVTQRKLFDKMISNVTEVKARGAKTIFIIPEDAKVENELVDSIIKLPVTDDILMPLITIPALQLFAYHMAVIKGCDVDKPRNLAKSVTVE